MSDVAGEAAMRASSAARDRILARVRKALGRDAADPAAIAQAQAYILAHRHGPRPAMPAEHAAMVEVFVQRAERQASTVERIVDAADIPRAVARYLDSLVLPPLLAAQKSHSGVCWPELAGLDWASAGLDVEARPTLGADRLGITGCHCAVAETGTVVIVSGRDTPTASALLPDTHVCVVRADRVVAGMEEAFALIRSELGALPRAVNFVSGPSRTGDVEQTIVLGAHGPYRVHLLLLG